MTLIAADIGATNTRLTLLESLPRLKAFAPQAVRYRNAEFDSFESLFETFLEVHHPGRSVDLLTLGLPAPVRPGEDVTLTNLDWTIRPAGLQQQFGIGTVELLNDLQAAALGTLALQPEQCLTLHAAANSAVGLRVVIGSGSGLGLAWVLTGEGEEYSHATEAGHMDFAPADDEQIALLNHLRKTYPHVSYERILSGPGLVNLYHFFAADGHETVTPAWVNEASEKGTDPAASKAMILYARIFGAFAGNIALSYRPQAGIYLTGGVAQKAARWLPGQDFTDAYMAKGRMRQVPEQTAVFLVTDELNGLNGILHHALNVAEKISRQHPTPLKKIYSTE